MCQLAVYASMHGNSAHPSILAPKGFLEPLRPTAQDGLVDSQTCLVCMQRAVASASRPEHRRLMDVSSLLKAGSKGRGLTDLLLEDR